MPASLGCPGDDSSIKIRDREDLIRNFIVENKPSVVKYFKSKGVDLEQ